MKGWFCGPTFTETASNLGAQVCRNWIPRRTPGGKSKVALQARPGLSAFGTAGPGPARGHFEQNGRAFFLSGTGFYEIDQAGTATLRGTVAYNSEPGTIHGNGIQLLIVSGGLGYIFTLATNVFAAISDPDFPTDVVMGFYLKGHFGVVKRNSRTFAISDEFDGTAWEATDLAEKSLTSDYLIGAVVDEDSGELWLVGRHMTEPWWYSGSAGFPLEPVPNVVVPTGGAAPFSWITVGGSVYGLGQSKDGGTVVVRFQSGYAPERISTHDVEQAIQGYPSAVIANARAFSMEWQGHRFYVLTFPDAPATWVYDEATGWWHEWSYWNTTTAQDDAFLGLGHIFAFGKHLWGSRVDGTIYEMATTFLDDDGAAIRTVRRAAYLSDAPTQLTHSRLWFDLQVGVGVASGQGSNPVGLVRYSDDQAQTWSHERQISLGALGQYSTQAQLWQLGQAGRSGRVYELVITDPVVRAITDCDVELA